MAEHRKQGLCYNYDEPYVHGHKCTWLFYLKASDYIIEETEEDVTIPAAVALTQLPFDLEEPLIPLSVITGIQMEDTM
jgi:hypothetical protein